MSSRAAEWSDPSPHTSQFLTVNGVRLHCLDWGGAGEPLILTSHSAQNVIAPMRDVLAR